VDEAVVSPVHAPWKNRDGLPVVAAGLLVGQQPGRGSIGVFRGSAPLTPRTRFAYQ
jgi:hypothetical protein